MTAGTRPELDKDRMRWGKKKSKKRAKKEKQSEKKKVRERAGSCGCVTDISDTKSESTGYREEVIWGKGGKHINLVPFAVLRTRSG